MKDIIQSKDWEHEFKVSKSVKGKLPFKYKDDFLDNTIPYLAAIRLIRNDDGKVSSTGTLQYLFENPNRLIKTARNTEITAKQLGWLVAFIGITNRSSLQYSSMNKRTIHAAFTPMLMYAHKLHYNIPYNDWDRNDEKIGIVLGKGLAGDSKEVGKEKHRSSSRSILEFKGSPRWIKDDSMVSLYRKLSLTERGGKQHPVIANKCNRPEELSIAEWNIPAMHMLLQTWICAPEIRSESSMILHPIDWDKVPEPFDAVVPSKEVKVYNEEKKNSIIPF